MSFQGENLFVGLLALAVLPLIAWRTWRGIRTGELPLYRTRFHRSDGTAKFNVLIGLHILLFLLTALIAADLLLNLGLRLRLGA